MTNKSQHSAEGKLETKSVRLSESLWAKLEQIARRKPYKGMVSDVVRDAIQQFVDQQEDIISSRGHFQRTFRERIDQLEKQQTESLNTLTQKIEIALSQLTRALTSSRVTNASPNAQFEKQQLEQFAALTARIDLVSAHLTRALNASANAEPFLTVREYERLLLEMHTLLHLQAVCFAKLFTRILPAEKELGDPTALLDAAITNAQRESLLYDTKLRLAFDNIPVQDVDEEALLKKILGVPPTE